MAKFLFQGRSPKQSRTYNMAKRTFNIETTKEADGNVIGTVKQPKVFDFVGVDARCAHIFGSSDQVKDITTPLTIGYEFPIYTTTDGQRGWRGLDLDFIANWFENRTDDYDSVLMFGYPLSDTPQQINISDSLLQSKFLVRKKDADGNWATVVDAQTDEVVFTADPSNPELTKNVDVYFYAHHMKNLDGLILVNLNVQKTEITDDIAGINTGHTIEILIDNKDFALSSEILSPLPIYANYMGQSVITTPKNSFRIRPYKSYLVNKLGLNKDNIKMQVNTPLIWQKLDNGDLEFTWKDTLGSSTYINLCVPIGDKVGDVEDDALIMNFFVFRQ